MLNVLQFPNPNPSTQYGRQLLAEWDDRKEINRYQAILEDLEYLSKFDPDVRVRKSSILLLKETKAELTFLQEQFNKKFGKTP